MTTQRIDFTVLHDARRLTLLLLLFACAAPLIAQEPEPLPFGQKVRGDLNGGDSASFRFVVPPGRDVVLELTADHVVLPGYCVQVDGGASDCARGGGGGDGDPQVQRLLLIPGLDEAAETVDLTLARPLDGLARYALVAYLQSTRPAPLGDILAYQVAAEEPYRVYDLTADPAQPLTVEIEDADERGNFLWAAFQPYLPNAVKVTDERLTIPLQVDGAQRDDSVVGIQGLALYYLGGDRFRALVTSTGAFSLHAASPRVQALDAGDAASLTVSYREPLRVLRLDADPTSRVAIDAAVVAGTGALITTYSQDYPYGEGLALGAGGRAGVPFPLFGTIDAGRSGSDPLVVVQIPFEFTRSQATVEVRWKVG